MIRPAIALLLAIGLLAIAASAAATPSGSQDVWRRLHRPLRLPHLLPEQSCPSRPARALNRDLAPVYGSGPAYVGLGTRDGVVHYAGARVSGGWYFVKALWAVDARHRGPVLIRGGRIDAPGELRFERGTHPSKELRIASWGSIARGWGARPSFTRIRGSGCYAYQVDGALFSRVIVFEARP